MATFTTALVTGVDGQAGGSANDPFLALQASGVLLVSNAQTLADAFALGKLPGVPPNRMPSA